jgi:hypothetical protein
MASRLDALIAIARLLAPKSKRVVDEVTQAFERPAAYFKAHRKRLDERSIDKPDKDLPWIALVDALTAAKVLVEIDWKTAADDLHWNLAKLGRKKETAWLAKIDPITDDRSTLELLEETGQRLLASHQLQLAGLDIGSDSYCLVMVPAADAKQLVALAKTAKFGDADLFTGKGLAAAKRERVAREKRDRAEAAKQAKREAERYKAYRYFARGKETKCLLVRELAVDTEHEGPGEKFYEYHTFKDRNAPAAFARDQIRAWKGAGFTDVDRETFLSLAIAKTAYIGWVGPFPTDAKYWLESKKIVRAVGLIGDTIWSGGGVAGKNFNELQKYEHHKTQVAAAADFAAKVEWHNSSSYKPIERAAVMKLYKR